jgi:hypothetical protein
LAKAAPEAAEGATPQQALSAEALVLWRMEICVLGTSQTHPVAFTTKTILTIVSENHK